MSWQRGVVVTGTDTGVGKTLVARALLTVLRERGLNPAAFKPCETGCPEQGPEDALALREASGASDALEDVCPYRFARPLAPAIAAELEGRRVDPARLLASFARLARDGRPVVVEGAGGALVPLNETLVFADLAATLGLPAVVVARDALGTLNHVALTVEALRARGIGVGLVVLNALQAQDDGTRGTNAPWLARSGIEIVTLPFEADAGLRLAKAVEALGRKFDGSGTRV